MRYMHKRIYFNKLELKEIERQNPTLFYLAEYVADKAHIIVENTGYNWVSVYRKTKYGKGQLMCPSELFHVPGTNLDSVDHTCSELRCWSMRGGTYPTDDGVKVIRPCWFRCWNDFVADMKPESKED